MDEAPVTRFTTCTAEELLGPLNEVEKKYAPATLFAAGRMDVLRLGPRVSIVGSRKASQRGLDETRRLSAALVSRGMVIVSGLAEGVDTVAHQEAIARGGKTIAVIGTPLDQSFPAKNRELQDFLSREHLVVSQFASGSAVHPGNFPLRNRTMALLSNATVIVEAGEKSGTEHQGWEALRLGRPLFLMESVLERVKGGWPEQLVGYGAHVLAIDMLDELREFLPERPSVEVVPFAS